MTTTEAIRARRSIRKYKSGAEITQEQMDLILEAAMMAPSARNGRPWDFVVVRDREKLNAITEVHPYTKMLATATLAIIICGAEADFFPQDCGAATQNILLQAAELGLGTCWCGVYPSKERVESIQRLLGIANVPFNVIAVGVPDETVAARGFYDKQKVRYI